MAAVTPQITVSTKLERRPGVGGIVIFSLLLGAGVFYAITHLVRDLEVVKATSILPFLFLIGALLIALGFEFVNGFHNTANAVATVIYTHSLEPHIAVAWSGLCNFTGVLVSSGAVAFAIVSLLPVELILKVGSGAGFAMVFSLLIAVMIWNLSTWYLGLPASSSHIIDTASRAVADAIVMGTHGRKGLMHVLMGSVAEQVLRKAPCPVIALRLEKEA